jgi:hypothetical protein
MAEEIHDVILISPSDDDSDCQIVKVCSSPGGQSKTKMRWEYHPYKLPRCRRSMKMTRQQNKDIDDDHQDKETTSNQNTQQSMAHDITTSGDVARNACSISMDQNIAPSRFGSMNDHPSDNEMSDAKAERSVMPRVDPTDPLANRHHTADLEPTSMLPPPFPSQTPDPSNLISILDDEDKQRESRSRSGSVATLDIPMEGADAQRGSLQGVEDDIQEIYTDALDEKPELLLGETIHLVDYAYHPQLFANPAMVSNEDVSILAPESLPEESNQASIKIEKLQDVETDLRRLCKRLPASRGRLPRVGQRRAWSSIINFAAYEAMLRPLFTQPKETINFVTFHDMVEERAEETENKK